MKIEEIDLGSLSYPYTLSNIYLPPKKLYVMGNKEILREKIIAIVGTREPSTYGLKVAKELAAQGGKVRVVSVPSTDLFDAQDVTYKEEILPNKIRRRVAIEMAATQSWYKYVGLDGAVIGIDKFGASAPATQVIENYGFTVEHVLEIVKSL